jgi:integrase
MTSELVPTAPTDKAAIVSAIDRAPLADSTKTKYRRALLAYVDHGGDPFDPDELAEYAEGLSQSGAAFLKAAIRLYTNAMLDAAKAQANPENVAAVQAIEYRTAALQNAIKVQPSRGERAHTWLTAPEVRALLATCDDATLYGLRDHVALALLVGAGLRRSEAVALAFDDIVLQPIKGKLRTVLQARGKGAKDRVIPISDELANLIDRWGAKIGTEGRVLRSIDRRREPRDSLSAQGLFEIVASHGAQIGKPELAPHDLRRSYAQIGLEAGVSLPQISRLLGHASLATTQTYLNMAVDLATTIGDFVPV